MNKADIENINKELKKRSASNYKWNEKGDLTKDDVMLRTTKELQQLIDEFKNNEAKTAADKVKKIVDELFAKYGEEDDNMIVFSAAYVPERTTYECDEPLADINFQRSIPQGNSVQREYNKLYLPICRNWECLSYYDRKDRDAKELAEWDKKWEEYYNDIEHLKEEIYKIKEIVPAEELWEDDNDALNELWYGVVGIMKDYKVVSFVIRCDGMLCDEDSYQSFHNSIEYEL